MIYMENKSRKKDSMSSAFDEFWASDYKALGPRVNTPKPKSSEDDAFDAFWGRNSYSPQPRMQKFNASRGNRYIADVKPVKYQQNVIQARAKLAQLQADLQRKQIEDKIAAINAQRFRQNVQTARQIAQTSAQTGRALAKGTVQTISSSQKRVMELYNKYLKKKPVDTSKEPVGVAGALYKARKEEGKPSIYD